MTDNKSLTYLMQLEENTKSEFTEVKNKIDSIDLSIGDLSSITSAIDEMRNNIDIILNFSSETNIVVKDILLGSNISDWIADLQSSGKNSATYKDSSRMEKLIASRDAVNTTNIATLLRDWSISNNEVGTFFGTYLDNPEGVDWDSLTTPSLLTGNSVAFNAIANNSTAFKYAMDVTSIKSTLYDNATVTEPILQKNTSKLKNYVANVNDYYAAWNGSTSYSGKFFVLNIRISENSSYYRGNYTYDITTKDGSKIQDTYTTSSVTNATIKVVNKFASAVSLKAGGGWLYADIVKLN